MTKEPGLVPDFPGLEARKPTGPELIKIKVPDRLRPALFDFADEMEAKLKKNDHKTGWRTLPVEALFRLLQIEIEEFKVAKEFLSVAEARNELVDIGNFCMILWDRLGLENQTAKATPDAQGI